MLGTPILRFFLDGLEKGPYLGSHKQSGKYSAYTATDTWLHLEREEKSTFTDPQ